MGLEVKTVTERTDYDEWLSTVFASHAPKAEDIAKMFVQAREAYRDLAYMVLHLPPTDERAHALRSLQEAMFWTNALIARNQDAILENLNKQRAERSSDDQ
jgi:hypothetical protein